MEPTECDDAALAAACLAHRPAALAAFEALLTSQVRPHVVKLTRDPDLVEETLQRVRIRLLVEGKLATYRGRGALGGFVRVTATRIAIDLLRATQPSVRQETELDLTYELLADRQDPTIALLRQAHGEVLRLALREAWAALPAPARFVLSMHLHEQCDIEQLANLYGVHRTTAARRLVAAQQQLLALCRDHLQTRLGTAGEDTIDSIIKLFAASSAWDVLQAEGPLFAPAHSHAEPSSSSPTA